jgi:predicted phosphodiesterase
LLDAGRAFLEFLEHREQQLLECDSDDTDPPLTPEGSLMLNQSLVGLWQYLATSPGGFPAAPAREPTTYGTQVQVDPRGPSLSSLAETMQAAMPKLSGPADAASFAKEFIGHIRAGLVALSDSLVATAGPKPCASDVAAAAGPVAGTAAAVVREAGSSDPGSVAETPEPAAGQKPTRALSANADISAVRLLFHMLLSDDPLLVSGADAPSVVSNNVPASSSPLLSISHSPHPPHSPSSVATFTAILTARAAVVSKQARDTLRVISDVHAGSSWYTPSSASRLRTLLASMAEPETRVHTLVVAGDLIELWLQVAAETPLAPSEVLVMPFVKPLLAQFKAIARNGVRVIVLRGNHDDGLTAAIFHRAVGYEPNISLWEGDDVVIAGVRVAHGHLYDIGNRADILDPLSLWLHGTALHPPPEGVARGIVPPVPRQAPLEVRALQASRQPARPVGYFVSRTITSGPAESQDQAPGAVVRVVSALSNRLMSFLLRPAVSRTFGALFVTTLFTTVHQGLDWDDLAARRVVLEDLPDGAARRVPWWRRRGGPGVLGSGRSASSSALTATATLAPSLPVPQSPHRYSTSGPATPPACPRSPREAGLALSDVRRLYADVYRRAVTRFGAVEAAAMARSSISGRYGYWLIRSPYLVEIYGHTHVPVLRRYKRAHPPVQDPAEAADDQQVATIVGRKRARLLGFSAPPGIPCGPQAASEDILVRRKRVQRLKQPVIYANAGSFVLNHASYVDVATCPLPISQLRNLAPEGTPDAAFFDPSSRYFCGILPAHFCNGNLAFRRCNEPVQPSLTEVVSFAAASPSRRLRRAAAAVAALSPDQHKSLGAAIGAHHSQNGTTGQFLAPVAQAFPTAVGGTTRAVAGPEQLWIPREVVVKAWKGPDEPPAIRCAPQEVPYPKFMRKALTAATLQQSSSAKSSPSVLTK